MACVGDVDRSWPAVLAASAGTARRRLMPRNLLTDVAGIAVGHAEDLALGSGVTAIMFDRPAVASVSVLGGGPGGRDTHMLAPEMTVEAVDAIVLSGGSAIWPGCRRRRAGGVARAGAGIRRRRYARADRFAGDDFRSCQWRQQGLGTVRALPRSWLCRRVRGARGLRARQCRRRNRGDDGHREGRSWFVQRNDARRSHRRGDRRGQRGGLAADRRRAMVLGRAL